METFEWRPAGPGELGFDVRGLELLCADLASRGTKVLLLARYDRIALEWYAPGFGPMVPHYTASLAKALVGGMALLVMLDAGWLDVDVPAAHYIPAWRGHPLKSRITLRHLATHSSGLADAHQPGRSHEELTGWMGAFWRRDPNPFQIALESAPVLFEPGKGYLYSNPGFAALGYVLTAALRGAPESDILALLRRRVMEPIGVGEGEWEIGYGRAYEMDGLRLYAVWGGGSYTGRAVARVGRLMLRRGNWQGRRLVGEEWVRRVTQPANTPLPPRFPSNPHPVPTLCWWSNADGVWPLVPRDAFCGAGAGNQVLLVVPSLDLVLVRFGEPLAREGEGVGFWGALERYLFNPLIEAIE